MWLIMNIAQKPVQNHPNEFVLHHSWPVHNGFNSSRMLDTSEAVVFNFDDYGTSIEQNITSLMSERYQPLFGDEARLSNLEMFIFCFDRHFSDSLSFNVLQSLDKLVNPKFPVEERLKLYDAMESHILTSGDQVFKESWTGGGNATIPGGMKRFVSPDLYANWMQGLIENIRKTIG